ncbi:MAG: hypothetical protein AVDCRST_MAG50-2720 [uncultured Acidimicrobiales bacterium]|uniref:AttH domain-containing protein n=1 Tax=uncultured Acidimicrobiales bacterium TaxID=310071 RepID=A0A6J4IRR2_9ACTN|nr:MAG: hypothetical protein AVDCRST_MAG50-2720 [uncultured Acidimicrobiales bacterium]
MRSAEHPHPPGADRRWSEWWHFDFAAPDGSVGGFLRLTLLPHDHVSWYWAYVAGEARPLVAVRHHDVELPRTSELVVRADGLWASVHCETPDEHWSMGLEAFGVAYDDPYEAWGAERGERTPLGWDLEFEAAGPPSSVSDTSYAQDGEMFGELLVGRERIAFSGDARRTHGWGTVDWWADAGSGSGVEEVAERGAGAVLAVAPVRVEAADGRVTGLLRELRRTEVGVAWTERIAHTR